MNTIQINSLLIIGCIIALAVLLGLSKLRPRSSPQCQNCKSRMLHVDEQAKLAQLDAGQQCEQAIRSIDYDIWLCPTCRASQAKKNILSSRYTSCPKCHYETLLVQNTVKAWPTESATGTCELIEDCVNCGYHHEEEFVLPLRETSPTSLPASTNESNSDSDNTWNSISHDDNDRVSSTSGGSSDGGGASGSW